MGCMSADAAFDPTTLRLFVAACEEGSLSRAAERRSLVPSAVSKRLAGLSEALGVDLFVRSGRGVVLTAAGEAMLRQAREILNAMHQAQAEMQDFVAGVSGSVRLVATISALSEALPDDIARFLARYDSVRVLIREHHSPEAVRLVREGRADLGVCWNAVDLSGLYAVAYRTDHPCVLVSPGHPLARRERLSFNEALDHEHVGVIPNSTMQGTFDTQARLCGKALRYRVEVSNFDTACRIVASGLGLAIIPREIAQRYADLLDLRLIALTDAWAQRRFVVFARSREHMSPTAQLLMEHLARAGGGR